MTEADHIAAIDDATDTLNKAIEAAVRQTELIVTLNTTTLSRKSELQKTPPSRKMIEQVEYTITKEIAYSSVNR